MQKIKRFFKNVKNWFGAFFHLYKLRSFTQGVSLNIKLNDKLMEVIHTRMVAIGDELEEIDDRLELLGDVCGKLVLESQFKAQPKAKKKLSGRAMSNIKKRHAKKVAKVVSKKKK